MRSVLVLATALLIAHAAAQGSQFLPFLLENRLPMSPMPRSYVVDPPNYFEKVPANEKLDHYNHSYIIPQCNNQEVNATQMNAYMFQTEKWLTTLGTDIYDAAVWCMAVTHLGAGANCTYYLENVLVADKTIQFNNIRGDASCNGIEYYNQCADASNCGFCYGDSAQSMTAQNAYIFRMISDYWAIAGTIDVRCPNLAHEWIWNDYKPVLGENAWAQLLGPAQVAMMLSNFTPSAISDDDPLFKLGIPFLTALTAMKAGDIGAIYYTPWNTWFGFSWGSERIGATFSVENQGSLLAGLEALAFILKHKPTSSHYAKLPTIEGLIDGLEKIILRAFDPNRTFFRQGGTYNATTGTLAWNQNNEPDFAVDCQTWIGAVLGTQLIDSKFGNLTAYNIWQVTKKLAGWNCPNGMFCGVGYTYTNVSGEVFSGEWTYGAINWLNVMIADSGYNETIISDLQNDVQMMEFGLETYLWTASFINNGTKQYNSVKYSNRRYYIPFGWFANHIPATASKAWAALVMDGYNPFNVNQGSYQRYPSV